MKDINEKVILKGISPVSKIHHNRSSFRLTDKVYEVNPELLRGVKKSERLSISSNIFEKMPEIFLSAPTKDSIKILGRENNERKCKHIRREYVDKHPTLGKWKVFIAKSNGTGAIGESISQPFIGDPNTIATQTFITFGGFDSESEAVAFSKYLKTKFLRGLLSVTKSTPDNARKEIWDYIPYIKFKDNYINFDKNVSEIDKQLYEMFELNDIEISYIENNVKEMV